MQITTVFDNVREMVEFAHIITGNKEGARGTTQTPPTSVARETDKSQPVTQATQSIAHMPISVKATATPSTAVPTTTPVYSLEDLSRAAMQLMDKGLKSDLSRILSDFGAVSLPELPTEGYGRFAMALREMGAQI